VYTLQLTKDELEEVVSSLEGQIDCLSYLVTKPYGPFQMAEKRKSLELAKVVLARAESLLKAQNSPGEESCR
jgi:hypothetical protein